ncbi:MAG TPA: hypothetical protein DD490_22375 [Acidobacteria bacterium]|nr:hypothetical protein [Acidobacteriota bacterium]
MRPAPRPPSAAFALVLFGLLLAVSLAWSAGRAARRIGQAWVHAGESRLEERSRHFGPAYALAIEEIRRTIPPDGVYALVDADADEKGGVLWVRFDLAPRRATYLGFLHDLNRPRTVRQRLVRDARWVIVASAERPPVLYERQAFLAELHAGRVR